jgi:hypothetical protein
MDNKLDEDVFYFKVLRPIDCEGNNKAGDIILYNATWVSTITAAIMKKLCIYKVPGVVKRRGEKAIVNFLKLEGCIIPEDYKYYE